MILLINYKLLFRLLLNFTFFRWLISLIKFCLNILSSFITHNLNTPKLLFIGFFNNFFAFNFRRLDSFRLIYFIMICKIFISTLFITVILDTRIYKLIFPNKIVILNLLLVIWKCKWFHSLRFDLLLLISPIGLITLS